MAEFFRYTRQYRPTRDNWEMALDFVTETANLAIENESEFIEKWIGNEINEMVAGLKNISLNPKGVLTDLLDSSKREAKFLYVRNGDQRDRDELKEFPEDISIMFKGEKLSAALSLLDKLQALEAAYPKVKQSIDEIKKLNLDFLPDFRAHISKLETDVLRRREILDPKIKERDNLKAKGKPHYDKVDELISQAREEKRYNFDEIRSQYFAAHPDFKALDNEVKEKSKVIEIEEREIAIRRNFIEKMEEYREIMVQYLDVAA